MKLNKIEKFERKTLKRMVKDFNGKIGFFNRVTVVIVPTCRGMAEFTIAICSANEQFNRKRGELVALQRWNEGKTLPIECACDSYNALDWDGAIADISMLVAY